MLHLDQRHPVAHHLLATQSAKCQNETDVCGHVSILDKLVSPIAVHSRPVCLSIPSEVVTVSVTMKTQ